MKQLLHFRIPGLPPSTNGLYMRSKKGVIYQTNSSIKYKKKMVMMFPKKPRIDIPVALLLTFNVRTPQKYKKRDLDNYLKCTIDGLQLAGQIRNDNLVIFCSTIKLQANKNFVEGYIYEMPEANSMFAVFHKLVLTEKYSK